MLRKCSKCDGKGVIWSSSSGLDVLCPLCLGRKVRETGSRMSYKPLLWAILAPILLIMSPGLSKADPLLPDTELDGHCLKQMAGEIQVNCRTRMNIVTISSADISNLSVSTITVNSFRGRILQVVSTYTTTNVLSTAASYVETTLSRQITPLSAGSTIYIFISQTVEPYQNVTTANPVCYMQITRNGTALIEYQNAFANNETGDRTTLDLYFINGITWIDSPNTTSPVRYGTQFQNASASGQCYTQDGGKSSMILMEVE